LLLAREWVQCGLADVALAVGFEQMTRDSMSGTPTGASTLDHHFGVLAPGNGAPVTAQFFGNAAAEHMRRYGTTVEQLASVAVKNHEHSTRNPLAQFQRPYALAEVLADKPVHGPLTRSQCSPMSDGAAAAVVVSERFVHEHGLAGQAVEIVAQSLVTDTPDAFTGSMID